MLEDGVDIQRSYKTGGNDPLRGLNEVINECVYILCNSVQCYLMENNKKLKLCEVDTIVDLSLMNVGSECYQI